MNVYINAAGAFLPNDPVDNDSVESRLGMLGGKPSPAKKRVLKQNQILTRHYALDDQGNMTHRNSEMAANAINAALKESHLDKTQINYLATATTLGDLFLPGFASMVQGETQLKGCEIASFQGVCASSMAALKAAYTGILAGAYDNAIVCGSELASRHFRAPVLESLSSWKENQRVPLDSDFLRWMLSDGAGAVILENKPRTHGVSLKIEWIEQRSLADTMETCMYAGAIKSKEGGIERTMAEYPEYKSAVENGLFILRQDIALLDHIVPIGVAHYLDLLNSKKLSPDFDWFLCHYSSHIFKGQIETLLQQSNATIPPEKWFTNLYQKGNTGAASIMIMLEELIHSDKLKVGQKILCQVPESGRFISSFMLCTVVGDQTQTPQRMDLPELDRLDDSPLEEPTLIATLYRQLYSVWIDFELSLRKVSIVEKIHNGTIEIEDYKQLLLNLRQQVMDGSRWISRAASNINTEFFELRSMYTKHSIDEHKDFKMLEANYMSVGGEKSEILTHPKNIGSEAFSSYMFHEASKENPFHLVGSVFIIEGIGNRLATGWAKSIQKSLHLSEEQVSFMLYHGVNDDSHLNEMHEAIAMLPLTPDLVKRIVKNAKVTARLYRLQLEEIGNY